MIVQVDRVLLRALEIEGETLEQLVGRPSTIDADGEDPEIEWEWWGHGLGRTRAVLPRCRIKLSLRYGPPMMRLSNLEIGEKPTSLRYETHSPSPLGNGWRTIMKLGQDMPATVASALIGRRVEDALGHPVFQGTGLTISAAQTTDVGRSTIIEAEASVVEMEVPIVHDDVVEACEHNPHIVAALREDGWMVGL